MNPRAIEELGNAMGEVYEAVVNRILINLAHHFPMIAEGTKDIEGAWQYQVTKLAEMGQVNRETEQIILSMLKDADEALQTVLENAIINGLKDAEKPLRDAAEKGLINGGVVPPMLAPNQMQAFQSYYRQSADHLNLVNTVMLESTRQAYQATVSDIVAKMEKTQSILNVATGEVVTGVTAMNSAVRSAVKKMVVNGITGYIDHAGRRWSPEGYVTMDIRTTVANAARDAVTERMNDYGSDLYQVSYHDGARPLCYPWQGKVISRTGQSGETEDGQGNKVRIYAESETSKGEPAGLFGINCGHYPIPFFPGYSRIRPPAQNEEENAKEYELSQKQRALERKLRNEKRDLAVLKAQGASEEEIATQRERVRAADTKLDDFSSATGRARRKSREYVPIKPTFPDKDTYDPQLFDSSEKREINQFFRGGSNQASIQMGGTATNIFGEPIVFSDKMNNPKWDTSKARINTLATEYKTKLKEVMPGASHGAGDTQVSGTIIHLSSKEESVAIHEFAHSISMERQTKFKLYDESDFWKEIRKVRTQYRKAVASDPQKWISTYEHSNKSIDEFMAEAFTLGYMREKGIDIPSKYGNDSTYSAMVLEIVKKYFMK